MFGGAERGCPKRGSTRKGLSTDLGCAGGPVRSSGEVPAGRGGGGAKGPGHLWRCSWVNRDESGRSCMDELKSAGKSFEISKWEVWEAYRQVKANKGAPGVDKVTMVDFETDLGGNLYRIWNRMSAGSYFPPPVKAVEIPKPHGGGTRGLGVPTISDRIAQTVAAKGVGGEGRTDLPSRLLRLPPEQVGPGRGGGMPEAVLEQRLGHRS